MRQDVFEQIEKFVDAEVPAFLKKMIIASGYDCELALRILSPNDIAVIEEFIQTKRELLLGTRYESMATFKFLPGHKQIILNIPTYIDQYRAKSVNEISKSLSDFTQLPTVLKSLVEVIEQNNGKHPKAFRYTETIRYFAIYIFLMCGRSCYDTLCANLPIPKSDTIGKYNY